MEKLIYDLIGSKVFDVNSERRKHFNFFPGTVIKCCLMLLNVVLCCLALVGVAYSTFHLPSSEESGDGWLADVRISL